MLEEIIIAGFGGQGIMSMGQLLAYAGLHEGKNVSWLPSYGPEQRGGTANCAIVISDEPVGSPLVSSPSAAIVLNIPSFEKFEPKVRAGGVLITNRSLVPAKSARSDIRSIEIDATGIANGLGNGRVANMVLLGAFIEATGILSYNSLIESLKKVLSADKHHLIDLNRQALAKGAAIVQEAAMK
ncbi:2-oxoacid:acceptor oxidoreductase family protein [Bacillus sp. FJAT-27245]|uniref:2-oxoacid:acceptor oxidoreductase family protein n=1 Tax=Bacillus sp. FJAT-27245 TaxID=1684144 RepID=UPI0006A7EA28|nr:2-oxoacid:acceptor oxidoreductase family protein [Bacillus sp. FJAT-27245]